MDKTLQDHVWKHCLPKEFKEEVKKEYAKCVAIDMDDNPNLPAYAVESATSRRALLEMLFGLHNLTSDAEGEEEMLYVSRKQIDALQGEIFKAIMDAHDADDWQDAAHYILDVMPRSFAAIFGSKCLPDEEYTTCVHASGTACKHYNHEEHRCSLRGECKFEPKSVSEISEEISDRVAKTIKTEFDKIEPKPAELKFKFGDKVRTMNVIPKQDIGRVGTVVINKDGLCNVRYNDNSGVWCDESDLEPYTEPEENPNPSNSGELKPQDADKQSRNLSQETANCDKQFDNILKDGFSKERRLNIAAMAMQGLLSNTTRFSSYEISDLVRISLNCADALIKKAEGGSDE